MKIYIPAAGKDEILIEDKRLSLDCLCGINIGYIQKWIDYTVFVTSISVGKSGLTDLGRKYEDKEKNAENQTNYLWRPTAGIAIAEYVDTFKGDLMGNIIRSKQSFIALPGYEFVIRLSFAEAEKPYKQFNVFNEDVAIESDMRTPFLDI